LLDLDALPPLEGKTANPPAVAAKPPASPTDVAATAATIKLSITALHAAANPATDEAKEHDAGRLLGARFMPDNKACVGLPTKIKGVYVPVPETPYELDGELVFAPGLTLDGVLRRPRRQT
jgi:hypothetical protein